MDTPSEIDQQRATLDELSLRLGEVLAAFAIMNTINDRCIPNAPAAANDAIKGFKDFWMPVTLGLQGTVITGVVAVLDKNCFDCATFYRAVKELDDAARGKLPVDFVEALDVILERYKRYRHKLFGHNDLHRESIAAQFDAAGFTWKMIDADIETLSYSLSVLLHLNTGAPVPGRDSSVPTISVHTMPRIAAMMNTHSLLDRLLENG